MVGYHVYCVISDVSSHIGCLVWNVPEGCVELGSAVV